MPSISPSVPPMPRSSGATAGTSAAADRKSTRLNSSHLVISYAVFCLKKKKSDVKPAPKPPRQTNVSTHEGWLRIGSLVVRNLASCESQFPWENGMRHLRADHGHLIA